MNREEKERLFQNPTIEYRAKPFWSWNGKLDIEEIKRQSDIMKEMGFGGYFMHSRTGLETEYLGDEWFSLIGECAEYGRKQGMQPWLYDEDRWPSGSAGGLATEDPKYRAMYMEMNLYTDSGWEEAIHDGSSLAVFGLRLENGIFSGKRRLRYGDRLREGETAAAFRIRYSELKDNYNGYCYLNTMKREATEKFIELTHEKYKEKCKEKLGREIAGIFTDEPHRGGLFTNFADGQPNAAPYTDDLFEEFEKHFGYSLKENLPELFLRKAEGEVSKVTRDYIELCQELFLENFAAPYRDWCRENKMLFTGHVLHENSLSNQTVMQGSLMRFYEYMDYPGIDFLGEWEECFWIVKQVDSVARQLGKRHVLSEMYAFTGWQTNFESYKNIGDWQALLGVNLRCPHLSWYTMKGQCKRDYPASILHQSGWYPEYHYVEDYFARIHAALQDASAVTELLVLCPVESVWARAYSGAFERLESVDPEIMRLEKQYSETFRILQENRIDFDYGEEELMSRYGQIKDGRLWVGACSYRKVLVSGMDVMRKSTLDLLEQFRKAGGCVIFAGDIPAYVNAEPSDAVCELAAKCIQIPFERNLLAKTCMEGNEVQADSAHAEKIYARVFQENNDKIIMLLNMDRRNMFEGMTVDLGTGKYLEEWNPRNGQITEPDYTVESGRIKIRMDLEGGGERIYRITETKRNLPRVKTDMSGKEISLSDELEYELTEPNICVLDQVSVQSDSGIVIPEREVLKADRALRERLKFPYRGGNMLQPWYQKKYQVGNCGQMESVTLTYRVNIEKIPGSIMLAAEDLEHIEEIRVNDHRLSLKSQGHWIDSCFDQISIPDGILKQGKNEICIRQTYQMSSGIEAIYLLGNFGVRIDGDHPVILELKQTLAIGDISTQGLPFYSGTVSYKVDIPEGMRTEVTADHFGGALVKLQGDTEEALAFLPYKGTVSRLRTIQVVLTRRNTFGPFHMKEKYASEYGPLSFITEGENWTDEYVLFEQGLLEKPRITEIFSGKTGA